MRYIFSEIRTPFVLRPSLVLIDGYLLSLHVFLESQQYLYHKDWEFIDIALV